MRTVATTINPTTRELQVVAGLTQANAGECHPGGTPDPQLSRRGGPGGADPEGNPDLGGDLAGRRTDARGGVHAGGEGADRTPPGRGPRPDDGRRHPGRLERGGAGRPHDRECGPRRDDHGRGPDGPEGRRRVHRVRRRRDRVVHRRIGFTHQAQARDDPRPGERSRGPGDRVRGRPWGGCVFRDRDTFRADLDFVVDLYDACTAAGAPRAAVCDTVGVMTPPGIAWFFGQLKRRLKPTELSFHGHNDFGLAVANSLAAVEAGVAVPHTCVNGLGERSGNASFEELVLALEALYGYDTGIDVSRIY